MPAPTRDAPSPDILDFYRGDGPMTLDPAHAELYQALPDDIARGLRLIEQRGGYARSRLELADAATQGA